GLVRGPEPLHEGDELVGELVGLVVVLRLLAEEGVLAAVGGAGDDVEAPAALRDEVDGGADLGDVHRVELVGDVRGGEEAESGGDRRETGGGGQEVGRLLVVGGGGAPAAAASGRHLGLGAQSLGGLG